jgi:FdrA protein
MAELVVVRPGAYHDSVTLMRASRALAAAPGVERAHVAMATTLNLGLAEEMGFDVPAGTGPTDLLIAVSATDPDAALAELDRLLTARAASTGEAGRALPRTTAAAIRSRPDANLALVSCPGEHAFAEALDAVDAGLSVMIFSDNVSVAQEVALKERAEGLVMGPDCGTAIVSGIGLGFANAARRGPVGIVAASGTGAQQVTCLLDAAGVGVSHVLGTGGRDLSAEVGARSTLKAMAMLDADPGTELVIVLSKTPDPAVAQAVEAAAAAMATPVEIGFLGADRPDLTAIAERTLARLGTEIPEWISWAAPAHPAAPRRGRLHGLYSGGTLCQEAAYLASGLDAEFTDFGDDRYTRGRAHPMIDPTLRLARLSELVKDPAAGAILLDVVLGHGADPDPAAAIGPALDEAAAAGLRVTVALIGTGDDPQGLHRQALALQRAGAAVFTSNAAAVRHARTLMEA